MKAIKVVFKLVLTRYNYGQPFVSVKKEFDTYPTEDEILQFLELANTKRPEHKDFHTDLKVEKIHTVINIG